MIKDLPSVQNEFVPIFDEFGTTKPPNISRVKPIRNTTQSAIAGEEGSVSETIVGHIGYSEYFNCLVYVISKKQKNIIRKVPGRGFAISKSIIKDLRDKNVKYVFGGIRESNKLLIIPLTEFTGEFHIQGWDKQLYATIDTDVLHEIPNGLQVLSDTPFNSNNSITMAEAQRKINTDE